MVRLGDVAHEVRESLTKSDVQVDRSVGLEHIEPGDLHIRTWDKLDESSSFTKVFREGHVLFGRRRAYLKKAALADFNGVCSGDITVISASEDLLPSLLPFVVSSDRFFAFAVEHSAGGLSPRVKWKDLANYEFLLPPKDQQAQIAELFWALEDSNEIYLGIEKKMSGLESAISRQAFPLDRTELLGDLATLYSGGTPSRKVPEYWGGDIPWVKTTEVDYSEITVTEESITALGLKESAAKLVRSGAILMAMYGQGVTRGRVSVLGIDASCNQACAVIEVKDKEIVDWVYFFLKFSYDSIRGLAQGATQENLNLGLIRDIQIPIIERNKMVTTTNILKQIVSAKNDLEKCSEDLKATRLSLIAELF